MPKNKHIGPMPWREYAVSFTADEAKNKIVCKRVHLQNGTSLPDVIYSQHGIKPHLPHLEPDEQKSWRAACKILNWQPIVGHSTQTEQRQDRYEAFKASLAR